MREHAPAPGGDREQQRDRRDAESCIIRSALIAPGSPSMLRTGALVAWLSEGSCTDQVASASAAMPAAAEQRDADDLAHAAAQRRAQVVREDVGGGECIADRWHRDAP